MAIFVDEKSKVLIQGITGREGIARTRLMKDYGTNVLAGVTPGRGGQEHLGLPVFDTVREAVRALRRGEQPPARARDQFRAALDAERRLFTACSSM